MHWYDEHARIRLPVLSEVLARFVVDVVFGYDGHQPNAIATVRRYATTVSTLHRLLSIPEPTKAAVVRNTLRPPDPVTKNQQDTSATKRLS